MLMWDVHVWEGWVTWINIIKDHGSCDFISWYIAVIMTGRSLLIQKVMTWHMSIMNYNRSFEGIKIAVFYVFLTVNKFPWFDPNQQCVSKILSVALCLKHIHSYWQCYRDPKAPMRQIIDDKKMKHMLKSQIYCHIIHPDLTVTTSAVSKGKNNFSAPLVSALFLYCCLLSA